MKIICIGRNYIDHAKELSNPVPKEPLIFMKPKTAIPRNGNEFYIPEFSNDIHYELELVLKIVKNGKHVAEKFASSYYEEIGLGIDFTARDVQNRCKEKGHPWEIAKAFDNSAIVGEFISKEDLDERNIDFKLTKNEEAVQVGNSKDLIFSFDYLISYVSRYFTLNKGDLLYTGTPAGVGPVTIGDKLEGFIGNRSLLTCYIK
ncbi:fumarylacetoacetate hydrolase family protein [Portibacter lacus]|uniref:2-hydroxyhepta-2,4-diene-1,7-dioate isomerase n=1 Tax=Portibacter lacus TaxID=1099794 RepID=A0AA37WEG6_9BACT|nr:fumarylacetoacetate hydrolase family protein [Portibacter lacus]GLR16739.1 2-hydroxyhepta-2,4-diene-1,7-dioate isomerase [Portibacter lacus]